MISNIIVRAGAVLYHRLIGILARILAGLILFGHYNIMTVGAVTHRLTTEVTITVELSLCNLMLRGLYCVECTMVTRIGVI